MSDSLAILLPIATARLTMRPLRRDDAESLREMTDHPEITGPIHFLPHPFTLADAEALLAGCADGRAAFLGAWEGASLVAVIGVHLQGEDEIEVGYWVRPDQHRKGFAREAVSAVLANLRGTYPSRAIVAECRAENTASWALLERLGFVPSGIMGRRPGRQRLRLAGL